MIFLFTGEISSKGKVDIEKVARDTIKEIGYDSVDKGLDYKTCKIIVNISKQSEDIALGVAKPVSIYIETFGTNKVPIREIKNRIAKFDLTPKGIIDFLDLRKPIYRKTTNYGHFGKSDLPWERIEKI